MRFLIHSYVTRCRKLYLLYNKDSETIVAPGRQESEGLPGRDAEEVRSSSARPAFARKEVYE